MTDLPWVQVHHSYLLGSSGLLQCQGFGEELACSLTNFYQIIDQYEDAFDSPGEIQIGRDKTLSELCKFSGEDRQSRQICGYMKQKSEGMSDLVE